MAWYKILLGTLALIGGATWYLKKRTSLTFEKFCAKSIDKAINDNANYFSQEIVKTVVVLTCEDNEYVVPYIYRRYANGTIKRKKIKLVDFPLELCPSNVKDAINKGEYILKTI